MVAWGSYSYGVVVAKVTASAIVTTAQLTPSAFGSPGSEALGVTIDSAGDVYATNYPYNVIDFWSNQTIRSYKGVALKPDTSVTPAGFTGTNYLAADGHHLYVDGFDSSGHLMLATVVFPSGATKVLQDNISPGYCGAVPGGIAVDGRHEVFVDNQEGTITGYRAGRGPANELLSYNNYHNEYGCKAGEFITGIALAYDQSDLWVAGVYYYYDGLYDGTSAAALTNPLGGYLNEGTPVFGNEYYYGVAASSAPRL
jgi:hypothetical protein